MKLFYVLWPDTKIFSVHKIFNKNFSKKHIGKKMDTFLRYLVYGCIVLYIIGWIRIVLKYILGSQGMGDEAVARRYRPLLEIYLIPI